MEESEDDKTQSGEHFLEEETRGDKDSRGEGDNGDEQVTNNGYDGEDKILG